MALVIKKIGRRGYWYEQHSVRVNGKVVTKSIYVGPVAPIRKKKSDPSIPKKRGGFGFFIGGVVALGIQGATGKAKLRRLSDMDKPVKATPSDGARDRNKMRDGVRALDHKYGVDRSNTEAWHDTRARLSPELFQEHGRGERAAQREYQEARSAADRSTKQEPQLAADMRAFSDRLASARAVDGGRVSAPAPEQPAAQSPTDAPASETESEP